MGCRPTQRPSSPSTPPAPLTLVPASDNDPPNKKDYLGVIARGISEQTSGSKGNYGKTLKFDNTNGIGVGSFPFKAQDSTDTKGFASGTVVISIGANSISLGKDIPEHLAATVCSFVCVYQQMNDRKISIIPGSGSNPAPSLSLSVKTSDKADKGDATLPFAMIGTTQGVFFRMAVSGDPAILPNTIVTAADGSSVTLSNPLAAEGLLRGRSQASPQSSVMHRMSCSHRGLSSPSMGPA